MEQKYIIYGLFDPRNGELRYVGKTEGSLRIRLQHHLYRARHSKSNTYKANWLRSVLDAGLTPEVVELETAPDASSLADAECWNISYYRSLGCRLTNLTKGGEGASGYRHTEATKRRMAEKKRGIPSHRRGIVQTPEARLKCSMTKTGLTEDQCKAVVACDADGLDSHAVGRKFGISSTSVLGLLRIFGVEPRNRSESRLLLTKDQEETVITLYLSGMSCRAIGALLGFSDTTARKTLKRAGIETRSVGRNKDSANG